MRKFRVCAAVLAVIAMFTTAFTAGAQAHVTFGNLAPAPAQTGCKSQGDLFQFLTAADTSYVVPENGVITSWSTRAGAGTGQTLEFKVFRPTGSGGYTVVAHDGPRPLVEDIVNTFKVDVPVKAGDVIGLNDANASVAVPNSCEFAGASVEDEVFFYPGSSADGTTVNDGTRLIDRPFRVNVSATLLQAPEIDLFGKIDLGSVAGGGSVLLKGNHFEEVSAVSFGGVPAQSFKVANEHELTAVAPAGRTLAGLPAAVTTPAGTATSPADLFYSGCQTPKLAGKTLAAAKKRLAAAGCKLGHVAKVRGRHGKVVRQSPAPGKLLAPGTKVSVKVGR